MITKIRVSTDYIEWAHGPAADSQHPPAIHLVDLCTRGRKFVTIDVSDPEIRTELASCANLWRDHREDYPSYARIAQRIWDKLR